MHDHYIEQIASYVRYSNYKSSLVVIPMCGSKRDFIGIRVTASLERISDHIRLTLMTSRSGDILGTISDGRRFRPG